MVLIALVSNRTASNFFFFFNDTATTEIYTLSLHDALPISSAVSVRLPTVAVLGAPCDIHQPMAAISFLLRDRKSTRLNSSHQIISYAVFCLKKKTAATAPSAPRRTSTVGVASREPTVARIF